MTVRVSTDVGRTRRPVPTVDGLPLACSGLVRIDARTVGLHHESGDFGTGERIVFRRVPAAGAT